MFTDRKGTRRAPRSGSHKRKLRSLEASELLQIPAAFIGKNPSNNGAPIEPVSGGRLAGLEALCTSNNELLTV
jgi:hypothetical protein